MALEVDLEVPFGGEPVPAHVTLVRPLSSVRSKYKRIKFKFIYVFLKLQKKRDMYIIVCSKIYRKSVLHLLKFTTNLYLSRCSTDLR